MMGKLLITVPDGTLVSVDRGISDHEMVEGFGDGWYTVENDFFSRKEKILMRDGKFKARVKIHGRVNAGLYMRDQWLSDPNLTEETVERILKLEAFQ